MESKVVLSIDCGTQSVRAMLFNQKGELLDKVKQSFQPYTSPQLDWAEQDADQYWENLCEVTRGLQKQSPENFAKIEAVTLTTQRDTAVFLDHRGRPLRPAVIWMDQRKLKEPLPFNKTQALALRLTGMRETAILYNRNCPAHWVKKMEPEIWEQTHRVLLLSGYLLYRLTGRYRDSDAAQAGKVPFNHKTRKWEPRFSIKGQIFQIPKEMLPELIEPGQKIGEITEAAALETAMPVGLLVIASASDKGCETIGSGCMDDTTASISLGSQASIQTTTKRYFEPLRFIPPFAAMIPGQFNPEIQVYKGYWMISWFEREFAEVETQEAKELGVTPESLLNKRLAAVPAGSDGLILQPLWGAGVKKPEARGSILGFNDQHTRIHIYRAIIEGIGYALLEGAEQIEKKLGHSFTSVAISGGGSQSDAICQITANLFNLSVYRVQTHETSGLGAAISGFVGLGVYKTFEEAIAQMVQKTDWFEPDPKEAKIYRLLYQRIYQNTYKRLKPLYKELRQIMKEINDEQSV
jgi:sugar (pentulose or hexulose) kinase